MRFLPKAMREPISLGYLLARLSDTVADAPGLELDERLEILARMRQAIIAGDRALPGNAIPSPADSFSRRGKTPRRPCK